MSENCVTVDVHDDLRNGREPFARIMSAVARLQPHENLRLLAPFQPVPLFHVLAKHGFHPAPRQIENGDWEVLFTRRGGDGIESGGDPRGGAQTEKAQEVQNPPAPAPANVLNVDARGLEPPQPMVKILEALAALPDGAAICARTDRRPMHLYAQLESRGFTGRSEEQSDGSFITIIRRN